jgi:RNA recognition motif-containing protein
MEVPTPCDAARVPSRNDKENIGMTKLFVGNISNETTDGDVRTAFVAYGPVTSATIVMDTSSGTSRGFAFVEMPSHADAVAAIKGMDGVALKGRTINVSRARPRGEGANRGPAQQGWALVGEKTRRW